MTDTPTSDTLTEANVRAAVDARLAEAYQIAHRRAELIDVRARWIEGRVQRRIERSSLRAGDVDLDAWEAQARREWERAHPALEAWLAEGGGGGE